MDSNIETSEQVAIGSVATEASLLPAVTNSADNEKHGWPSGLGTEGSGALSATSGGKQSEAMLEVAERNDGLEQTVVHHDFGTPAVSQVETSGGIEGDNSCRNMETAIGLSKRGNIERVEERCVTDRDTAPLDGNGTDTVQPRVKLEPTPSVLSTAEASPPPASAPALSQVQQLIATAQNIPNFPVPANMTPEQQNALALFLQHLAASQQSVNSQNAEDPPAQNEDSAPVEVRERCVPIAQTKPGEQTGRATKAKISRLNEQLARALHPSSGAGQVETDAICSTNEAGKPDELLASPTLVHGHLDPAGKQTAAVSAETSHAAPRSASGSSPKVTEPVAEAMHELPRRNVAQASPSDQQQQQMLDILRLAQQGKEKSEGKAAIQLSLNNHGPTSQASTESREHLLNLLFKASGRKGSEAFTPDSKLPMMPSASQDQLGGVHSALVPHSTADIPAQLQQVLGAGAVLQPANPPLSAVYAKESGSNEPSTGRTRKRKEVSTTVSGSKTRRKKKAAPETSNTELASSGDALSSLVNDLADYLQSKGVTYEVHLDDADDEPEASQMTMSQNTGRGRRARGGGKGAGSFKTTLLKGLEECLQKCIEITKSAQAAATAAKDEPMGAPGANSMSLDFLSSVLGGGGGSGPSQAGGAADLFNRAGGLGRVAGPALPLPQANPLAAYQQASLQPQGNPGSVGGFMNTQPQMPMDNNFLSALQRGLEFQNSRPPTYPHMPAFPQQPPAQPPAPQHDLASMQQSHNQQNQRQAQLATLLQQVAPHAHSSQLPVQQQAQLPSAMPNLQQFQDQQYSQRPMMQQSQQQPDWQRIAQLLMPGGGNDNHAPSMGAFTHGGRFDPNARR